MFHIFDNHDFNIINLPIHFQDPGLEYLTHSEFFSVSIISFLFYFLANFVLFKGLPFWDSHYSKVDKKTQCDWNSRYLSNVNAFVLIVVLFGSYLYHYDTFVEQGIHALPRYTEIGLGLGEGYFIHDTLFMFYISGIDGLLNMKLMYFHHFAALICPPWMVYHSGAASYVQSVAASTEISTFFLNQRWFLATKNLRDSPQYKIVNILFGVTFLFSRIPYTFVYMVYFFLFNDAYHVIDSYGAPIGIFFTLITIGFSFMNLYWAFLIIRKILAVRKKTSKSDDSDIYQQATKTDSKKNS